MEIIYRKIQPEEIEPGLFSQFQRFQKVEKCWRKEEGQWVLKDIAFTEDWDAADYRRVCAQLTKVLAQGGAVWGAFFQNTLKGFASVEKNLIGSSGQYAVLAEMHVSQAKKLYISAMSAAESQAFYHSMGCVEALEYDPCHVEKEPCDVQMEFLL